jgi:hypothetical protein
MTLQPVSSSMMNAIGWENGVLRIQWSSGKHTDFRDVPEEVFNAMLTSESVGKFYHANIKGKFYE